MTLLEFDHVTPLELTDLANLLWDCRREQFSDPSSAFYLIVNGYQIFVGPYFDTPAKVSVVQALVAVKVTVPFGNFQSDAPIKHHYELFAYLHGVMFEKRIPL